MTDTVPDLLDHQFLTECLRKEEGRQALVVTDWSVSPGAPTGNGYCSLLFRVRVQYRLSEQDDEEHSTSLIIKCEKSEGGVKVLFGDVHLREHNFYYEILPRASRLTDVSFAPKSHSSPNSLMVILQDLVEEGFTIPNKSVKLDFDHCHLYVIAAASMHASTFAVHKEDPALLESFGKETFLNDGHINREIFGNIAKCGLKCMADAIKHVVEYKRYVKLVEYLSEKLWELTREAQRPSRVLNTFCQGDPWVTNMMFKYDEQGKVKEVKLLDFQKLRYGSPAYDLTYFVWSTASHDVIMNRLDDLYHIYVDTFNNKLREMKFEERLTFQDLRDELTRLSPMALLIVIQSYGYTYTDSRMDFRAFCDVNIKAGTLNPYVKLLQNDYVTTYIPNIFEELEKEGVLQYLEKLQTYC